MTKTLIEAAANGPVIEAQKNQKVIITVLDEYIEKKSPLPKKSVFGKLSRYASPALIDRENTAWEKSIIR